MTKRRSVMSVGMGANFDPKNPHVVFSRHPPPAEVPSGVQFVNDAIGPFMLPYRVLNDDG